MTVLTAETTVSPCDCHKKRPNPNQACCKKCCQTFSTHAVAHHYVTRGAWKKRAGLNQSQVVSTISFGTAAAVPCATVATAVTSDRSVWRWQSKCDLPCAGTLEKWFEPQTELLWPSGKDHKQNKVCSPALLSKFRWSFGFKLPYFCKPQWLKRFTAVRETEIGFNTRRVRSPKRRCWQTKK